MKYRREIDGLRAIAVLPVIFFHAGFELFRGGFVGVDVFFVISGYLITTIILADQEKGTFSLLNFYERRARRILPALFIVMLASIPFAWFWLLPDDMKSFSKSLVAAATYMANILFWHERGYFTATELKPLLHTWSLAVEEQYYAFFPLVLMLVWRLGKKYIFTALFVIALLSLALAQIGSISHPTAAFFLLPTRAWELMVGGLVAFVIMYRKQYIDIVAQKRAITEVLGLLGLALILYAVFSFNNTMVIPGLWALVPTIGTALIILFVSPQTATGKFLGSKIAVGIGLISYSAYLWHQPLFVFARHRSLTKPGTLTFLLLSAAAIGLAYLSWRYIERPFRTKGLISRNRIFSYSILGMIFFILFGSIGYLSNGFTRQRFSEEDLKPLAEAQAMHKERIKLSRYGECQFDENIGKGLEQFINEWNCYDDAESEKYTKLPLAVVGDSLSADLVVSLKLSGFLPMQIAGNGCFLAPSLMKEECRILFSGLRTRIEGDKRIKYIALYNRYTWRELSPGGLKEIIDYWSGFGKKLIFFTAMPEFSNFNKTIFRKADTPPFLKLVKYSERKEVYDYLKSRNVHVISTSSIFCKSPEHCPARDDEGNLLLTDGRHMTKQGSIEFGQRLIKMDPVFRDLTRSK